jgi:hypothetical protein
MAAYEGFIGAGQEREGPRTSWLMDRGTNETPGSESKGGRQKLHLGPPYKTNMSYPGPGLWLERPKARGTFIRKPVVCC